MTAQNKEKRKSYYFYFERKWISPELSDRYIKIKAHRRQECKAFRKKKKNYIIDSRLKEKSGCVFHTWLGIERVGWRRCAAVICPAANAFALRL